MITFSASSLSSAKGCPRAMAFSLNARLRKVDTKGYLALGSGVHAGIAAYYSGADDMLEHGLDEAAKVIKRSDEILEEERDKVYSETTRLLMWYRANAPAIDLAEGFHVLGVEQKFCVELSPEVRIIGVIDILAQVKGNYAIVDTKTAAAAGTTYFHGARYDAQYRIYSLAAKAKGIPIDRFGWNVIKKTKEPAILREYIPINWDLVEGARVELIKFGNFLAQLPFEPYTIFQLVPGNVGKCRRCPFVELCTNPQAFGKILETDFRVSDPEEFLGTEAE